MYVDIMVVVQPAQHKICAIIIIGLVSLEFEVGLASKLYRSMLT